MTTVILLLLGFGAILLLSAAETDPATGRSVSVVDAFKDAWNNTITIGNAPAVTEGNPGAPFNPYTGGGTPFGAPMQPGTGIGYVPLSQTVPASSQATPAATVVGSAAGPAPYGQHYDAYRAAVVRAYLQSQR